MTKSKDHLTPEQRSLNMAKIKQKDSKAEVLLRSLLHRQGYRFRKNVKTKIGKHDYELTKYRTVIFVHGCYLHRHYCRRGQSTPTARREFWEEKFRKNVERDRRNQATLESQGWNVVTVWECELKGTEELPKQVADALPTPAGTEPKHTLGSEA